MQQKLGFAFTQWVVAHDWLRMKSSPVQNIKWRWIKWRCVKKVRNQSISVSSPRLSFNFVINRYCWTTGLALERWRALLEWGTVNEQFDLIIYKGNTKEKHRVHMQLVQSQCFEFYDTSHDQHCRVLRLCFSCSDLPYVWRSRSLEKSKNVHIWIALRFELPSSRNKIPVSAGATDCNFQLFFLPVPVFVAVETDKFSSHQAESQCTNYKVHLTRKFCSENRWFYQLEASFPELVKYSRRLLTLCDEPHFRPGHLWRRLRWCCVFLCSFFSSMLSLFFFMFVFFSLSIWFCKIVIVNSELDPGLNRTTNSNFGN